MKREDSEVVPRVGQILKARWDAAASMAVMEIKLRCDEFKVTSSEYGATVDEGKHDIVLLVAHRSPLHQQSSHITKPAVQWCLPGQFGWHQERWCYKATACHVTAVRSAKEEKDKKTKQLPGCRGFTDRLFKLWLQRS
jgi:hypothetical protein